DPEHSLPTAVRLHQNYPNPFHGHTTIRYQLRLEAPVALDIVRPDGRIVRRLVGEAQGPGFYTTEWDGREDSGRVAPSGVYLMRLTAGRISEVKKLTLLPLGG
ncbi:MAG: T9SS type A sorting domain-containing protein, partial [Candidatus Eisenbacteria bacterium]|nr:T9SS type A sorting domain-containing protein [Candidatus Eisenbacteria bacterium]